MLQAGQPWIYIYYKQESRGYATSRTTVDIYILQAGEPWIYYKQDNRGYICAASRRAVRKTTVDILHSGRPWRQCVQDK